MKQVMAEVVKNEEISTEPHYSIGRVVSKSKLILLKGCDQIAKDTRPGQFIMLRCGRETLVPRPLSIHKITREGHIALLFSVWKEGKGTNWLAERQVGDKVELFGPLGNGFSINQSSSNLLLIAGGIGVAPLYFLAQDALSKECQVTLLVGARKSDLLKQLQEKNPLPQNVKLFTIAEEDGDGQRGRVTDLIATTMADSVDQVFVSGPMGMYRYMYEQRETLFKGKPVQISLEVRMACGLGVCYGCTVKTTKGLKQVCKDGPVFDLDEVLWGELGGV